VALEEGCSFEKTARPVEERQRIREPHLVLWDVDWHLAEQVVAAAEASGREVQCAHLPLFRWCHTSAQPGMVEYDYWYQLRWILRTRGISPEALSTMQVGWAPEHQAFSFPLRRIGTGELLGWAKRDPFNPGYYVSGTHLPRGHPEWALTYVDKGECLWGASEMRDRVTAGEPVYLCEGYLDALRVQSCGYVGMAMQGKRPTEQQTQYLNSITNPLVLWPDNDRDGLQSARLTVASFLARPNFSVISAFFGVKDAGDMSRLQLQMAARNSIPGSQFLAQWSNLLAQLST